jgi:hypothetical protein
MGGGLAAGAFLRRSAPLDLALNRLPDIAAPRCGARSKRTGKPCQGAAMPNGRCKLHGGKNGKVAEGFHAQAVQGSELSVR